MAYITINKNNFFYNLDKICEKTKSKDKIALVLKDNAYGHGLFEMASLAKEYGISKVVVQLNSEAGQIENMFDYVLVLSDIPTQTSDKIRYTINSIDKIKDFPHGTKVELKVNTGMNRNGVRMSELGLAFELIKENSLTLEAVFTHHACADELNENYDTQKSNFDMVKSESPSGLRFHSCNSAALFRNEDFNEDMARVGIAAYGCLKMPASMNCVALKPVLSMYASKISSQTLKEGEGVGYSMAFKAQANCIVSNYDVGYGDGFLRACSNVYTTPIGVQIAGRISMDNSSFVSDEDELLIFNDARVVSKIAKTISYEALTSLKPRLKRKIV